MISKARSILDFLKPEKIVERERESESEKKKEWEKNFITLLEKNFFNYFITTIVVIFEDKTSFEIPNIPLNEE